MKSISSQVYNFSSTHEIIQKNKPILDFLAMSQTNFSYQYPIFKKLREEMMKIFHELKEMTDIEEIRKKFKLPTEPWDQYLYLDSRYFVNLLCQDKQLSTWELACFIEFIVYSIKNELISKFKIDMKTLREEFLKHSKSIYCDTTIEIIKNPETVDPVIALKEIDEKIIKSFYIEAKMNNWLKEYQDDYDELLTHGTASGIQKFKPDMKPEPKSISQQFIDNILTLKK